MIFAKLDANAVYGILSLIGFVVGFFTQNPYTKKYVPKWLTTTMEKLPPEKIDKYILKYGSKELRRETATELLQGELAEHGIVVDYTQSGQVIDYLTQRYKETIGKVIKR